MKKSYKVIIPIMALLFAVLCGISVQLISQIQSYGKLINYVGIVRGATQRLVKLEITNLPNDKLIMYLDDILVELTTGEGPIGLVKIDDPLYNRDLGELIFMWEQMKPAIMDVRNGHPKDELIRRSETYFHLADKTVFAAEKYSNYQTKRLFGIILAMVIAMGLSWAIILTSYVRRLLHLETTNQSLSDKVYTDQLTGAPNLEKFRLDAQSFLTLNPHENFAVFYVDIDNFKYYNDVFGVQYGDEILRKYADIIKSDVRAKETFCHISSDNFLIFRYYHNKDDLIKRQEDIDERIANYVRDSKEQYLFTLTYGICCTEDLTETHLISGMIEQANFARKTVKNQPMIRYAFYNESIRERMLLEKDIENRMYLALENKEFVVFMQPKVSLTTGHIACSEALVRWITPDGRIVPPNEFIPIFEKNLFISTLDQYVMEEVCSWIRSRLDANVGVLPVSVNASRMQLYDPDFVKTYAEIKNKYQIPDGMLEIEFTESMVFENLTVLLNIIALLKQEGFLCSLDDFGKGYSSLNLLRNLPVDVLKLDKLFFDEDDQPEKARTIIMGIVAMVNQLNMLIVAEGVEQEEQVDFLREIGCDLVQGYVFYKPMFIVDFEQLIDNDVVAAPHTVLY